METKFTKGKWMVEEHENDHRIYSLEDELYVAFISKKWDNHEANAMLIKEAPDLFWMLVDIVDTLKDNYILGDEPFYSTLEEADLMIKRIADGTT